MKPIYAKMPEQKEYEQVSPGNYIARCYSMVQLGTHKSEYKGKEKIKERVRITWELPTEIREDGSPFVIGQEYTLSMHEMGSLRPMLESWRGKAFSDNEAEKFDITKILEIPCLINIIHNESSDGKKKYANISSVSPIPKGMECPPQINETVVFTIDDITNEDELEKIPEFMVNKIKESMEYKGEYPKSEEEINVDLEEDEIRLEDIKF